MIRRSCSFALLLCLMTIDPGYAGQSNLRGNQFIGFSRFSKFTKSEPGQEGQLMMTSPRIETSLTWTELIASWNVELPPEGALKLEARAIYPDHTTKYFVMGLWSLDPTKHPRESLLEQEDPDGDVHTDTLRLSRPTRAFQLRITLLSGKSAARLKFVGVALSDPASIPEAGITNRKAWGKVLPVPERSQMPYPNGKELCSPTTVSMLLGFWSTRLHRTDLEHDVPEISDAIYDTNWNGTGNWPFNTAYAGSFHGMRAYVSRFSELSELEDWIATGLPVGLSLCYNRLRGFDDRGPSGHLVVCVGFTKGGDVILNDPGTSKNVRKIFSREKVLHAWDYSHRAVYLIYPDKARPPKARFPHWDSPTARKYFHLRPGP